jgi:geranylgeranyl diphosphate synthase, type II
MALLMRGKLLNPLHAPLSLTTVKKEASMTEQNTQPPRVESGSSFAKGSPIDSLAALSIELLAPYKHRFLQALDHVLPSLGPESTLKRACVYALKIGGKRLRPSIVYMVADALGKGRNVDMAALIVEFFHVSSLISDDLPCMDDDDFRRGEPTTHKVFSESIALLASFGLTSAGFELLSRIPLDKEQAELILRTTVGAASRAVGLVGIIGGQQFDLYPEELERTLSKKEAILKVMDMKTGALFSLSFLFGWIFGGGHLSALEDVQQMAVHFGRAFQILDDIDDYDQDVAAHKKINFAIEVGLDEAKRAVAAHIDTFSDLSAKLGLSQSPLLKLTSAMRGIVSQ